MINVEYHTGYMQLEEVRLAERLQVQTIAAPIAMPKLHFEWISPRRHTFYACHPIYSTTTSPPSSIMTYYLASRRIFNVI